MYDDYDFDEYNDWDATSCANGDYNAWEEEQVFQDSVAQQECYICGEPCDNPQGRHYECACESGEDLDDTLDFGDLSHVW